MACLPTATNPVMSRTSLRLPILLTALAACRTPSPQPVVYERRELTIPMRDSVALSAVALVPKGTAGPFPILLIRTPFGAAREFRSDTLPPSLRELGEDGYIFVVEDVRGRGQSGGAFVSVRPQRLDSTGVDESTDAWDTVDWLVRNVPGNNGKVGVLGISYRGWLAALAAVNAHPAIKAISPQGLMTDTWLGDDFFHQGAFRQTQGVAYAAYIEGTGELAIPDSDQFDFYQRYGTLEALGKAANIDTLPSWSGFRAHPGYDAYWHVRALQNVYHSATVPTLVVGGWWDAEDLLGPQLIYRTLERADSARRNYLVMGPWTHGSWARPGGDSIGAIPLGSPTADYFREEVQRPWFAHFLHGKGDGLFPEALVFESGANVWRQLDAWPPRDATPRKLYLREGGQLTLDAPAATTASTTPGDSTHTASFDEFVSDPADPVPYIKRPDNGAGWNTWLAQDQRFLGSRSDVLTWTSAPLEKDLTVAGDVIANLFASTTGTDADWVVRLIDVYPESTSTMGGYQLMVNGDVLRGRYWKGFTQSTPIPANTVTPFTVDLHGQLYRFQRGHRIMVQVQSSWFPLYDRNPQQFVPNVFLAKASDFRAQVHRVWHTERYPSHLAITVIP